MEKSIMLSIKPKWVVKILNGEKTIEIRKKFPKDFVGWVYIYCTKDSSNLLHKNIADIWWVEDKDFQNKNKYLGIKQQPVYNGKVVARFWCDKVEEIKLSAVDDGEDVVYDYETATLNRNELLDFSNLTNEELHNYLDKNEGGHAIHISKLEIFDKPKEISEFFTTRPNNFENMFTDEININGEWIRPMKKPPQSWCYVIGEEMI